MADGGEISDEDSLRKGSGPPFISVPTELLRRKASELTFGAKLLYGRLHLYGRKTGICNPSQRTLAKELGGISERQVRNLLAELSRCGLVDWRRTGSSASYQVNPPSAFVSPPDGNEGSHPERKNSSTQSGNGVPIKRGSSKEVSRKDVKDLDCLPANRKPRDTHVGVSETPSCCKQYPKLRALIAQFMADDPKKPTAEDFPTDRKVVEIKDAAMGATEEEVVNCLVYLSNERGLRPNTKNGPRSFNWFPVVVQDYFQKRAEREDAANPIGHYAWEDRNETKFDNQSDAFDPTA